MEINNLILSPDNNFLIGSEKWICIYLAFQRDIGNLQPKI